MISTMNETFNLENRGEIMDRLTARDDYGTPYYPYCDNVKGCGGYCAQCTFETKSMEKLANYEDLEEQGLLLRLPCGIGTDIYFIPSETNFKLNIINNHEENNRVYHQKVEKIIFNELGWFFECDKDIEYGISRIFLDKNYQKIWFLTQKEAEQKLKEMSK